MSETTPRLSLPLIMAAQAQKHVMHNEALMELDVLVQLAVRDRWRGSPPATPDEGDQHIVAADASGAWAGHAHDIAVFRDGGWSFCTPRQGYRAFVIDDADLLVFQDGAWAPVKSRMADTFGVNATASLENRLAVASGASLFDNAGEGHQLKINKATLGSTAAVLFQNGYSGRAEIGLTGDDNLHVKVSADGATWTEAFQVGPDAAAAMTRSLVNPANGSVNVPLGVARFVLDTPDNPSAMAVGGGAAMLFLAPTTEAPTFIGRIGYSWNSLTPGSEASELIFYVRNQAAGDSFALHPVFQAGIGHVLPGADNSQSLGSSASRWSEVHAVNGVIQTSDERDKQVMGDLPFAASMVDRVNPVLFQWKADDAAARPHAGFLAQDIKRAMDGVGVEFAAWGLDEPEASASRQWTSPAELVAVLWAALRQTRERLAECERRLAAA